MVSIHHLHEMWFFSTEILHAAPNMLKYNSKIDNVFEKMRISSVKRMNIVSIEPPKNFQLLSFTEQVHQNSLIVQKSGPILSDYK
jgi:hypothetical protein